MKLMFYPQPNGLYVAFVNKRGRYWSWFNSPPASINHVDRSYLQGRWPNVRDVRHVNFIKREWLKWDGHQCTVDDSVFRYLTVVERGN